MRFFFIAGTPSSQASAGQSIVSGLDNGVFYAIIGLICTGVATVMLVKVVLVHRNKKDNKEEVDLYSVEKVQIDTRCQPTVFKGWCRTEMLKTTTFV